MVRRWMGRLQRTLLVSPETLAADHRLASRTLVPEAVLALADVRRLAELGPRNTRFIDIGRLLGIDSRVAVLRSALEEGIRMLFIESASSQDVLALENALPDLLWRLDDPSRARDDGALHGVSVKELLRRCLASDPAITATALADMPTRHVPNDVMRLLPPQLPVRREGPLRRLLGDPRAPVYLAVAIYSALRALPVALIPQFHGSLLILWSIDIITAIPYTWGVLAMLFAPRVGIRALAAATTLVTFVAPYVYFWLNGRDYPLYVVIVIAALTAITIVTEVGRCAQEKRLRTGYRRARVAAAVRMAPVTISQMPDASHTATIQGSALG